MLKLNGTFLGENVQGCALREESLDSGLRQERMVELLYLGAHGGIYICCGIGAVHVCTYSHEACI